MNKALEPGEFLHEQYDKISDDVIYVGDNGILRMNVKLNKKTANGMKTPVHTEFLYLDRNQDPLVTIRRSFQYYLSLETLSNGNYKESIMITQSDFPFVKSMFSSASKWFTEPEFAKLFAMKDKKVVLAMHPEPLAYTVRAMSKYITMEPQARVSIDGTTDRTVCICMNSRDLITYIKPEDLIGISSFLSTFNMFQSAQGMVNYLGRPEQGHNLIDLSGNKEYVTDNPKTRQPRNKSRKKGDE